MFDEQNLVTLDQVRSYCRITDSGANAGTSDVIDEVLKELINRTSSSLVEATGLPFIFAKDLVSVFNGQDDIVLFAPIAPINSVTSVSVNGAAIPKSTSFFTPGWTNDSDAVYLYGYTFSQGVQNVSISWNLGLGQTSQKVNILQQACLELINFKWQRRKHPDVKLEKGSNITTVEYTPDDISLSIRMAIDMLRQKTILFT